MEVLIIILIIAIIWLFIKSSNNNTNIDRINEDVKKLIITIEFLQNSITGLEKSRDEQRHKNYDLRKQLADLQSAHIFNTCKIEESPDLEKSGSKKLAYAINPTFAVYIYKDNDIGSLPFPLAYSCDFSQFLQQKLCAQTQLPPSLPTEEQTQNQSTAKVTAKVNIRSTPQHKKPRTPAKPPEPTLLDKAFEFAKNWLTTGNIPVKIGMLVLISAVIAFLRYATTMGWISVPIHVKLLAVAVSALGALAFAWTKRDSKRSFSLSVQGGSIGIVLLTIFSAVKMYPLMSPTVGFVVSLMMVLLTAVLSIQQNAKVLALMAIFAGFLAPIWLSDGSGSQVVLFSYYAVLNVGIFILATFRPWRELNVLGFVFTYVIGSTVGGLNYTPEDFSTIEPFVILFFFFYLLIPLRYAQQANSLMEDSMTPPPSPKGGWSSSSFSEDEDIHEIYNKYRLNSGLLFGTPLVTLVAHVALLENNTHLALSCVAMGVIYGALALLLKDHRHENIEDSMFATLQKTYTGLSASFLTLAVPIGLSAKATTTIFALEGAGAIWLGAQANPQRRRTLTWLAGGFLQLSATLAFLIAFNGSGYGLHGVHADDMAILNELYLSGMLLAVAGLLCAWFSFNAVRICKQNDYNHSAQIKGINAWLTNGTLISFSRLFFLWGMAWWIGINLFEITRIMGYNSIEVMYGWMICIVATAVILPIIYNHHKGYHDDVVWAVASLLMMTGGGVTLIQWFNVVLENNEIPFGWATISWALFAVGGWLVWRGLQTVRSWLIDWSVVVWFLAITLTVSTLVYQLMPHSWHRESGWHWGIIFAVWIVVSLLDIFRPQALAWLANRPRSMDKKGKILSNHWQIAVRWTVVMVLAGVFAITTFLSGSDGWWLPILNSVDGLQIVLAFLLLAWCVRHKLFAKVLVAYIMGFAMVISMSVRMVRHWAEDGAHWHGNIENISDWHWLMIFGFWTVIGFGLWALLTDKLSAISKRLPEITLEIFQIFLNSIMLVLVLVWCVVLLQSGEISPWIPLLNPLAVLQWSIVFLLWLWAKGSNYQYKLLDRAQRSLGMACLVLTLVSVMTLRFTFHSYGSINWDISMLSTAIMQMALTIVWSILGVVGWIVGSRRLSKPIWLLGAVLMAVVLIKLVLIDRGHLGNLFGIISFFAYGMLCVIVGYIAPMPRFSESNLEEEHEKDE